MHSGEVVRVVCMISREKQVVSELIVNSVSAFNQGVSQLEFRDNKGKATIFYKMIIRCLHLECPISQGFAHQTLAVSKQF